MGCTLTLGSTVHKVSSPGCSRVQINNLYPMGVFQSLASRTSSSKHDPATRVENLPLRQDRLPTHLKPLPGRKALDMQIWAAVTTSTFGRWGEGCTCRVPNAWCKILISGCQTQRVHILPIQGLWFPKTTWYGSWNQGP